MRLKLPQEPLMAVLFNEERDFREYSTRLSPELASAAGFWNAKTNVSFFYDHGTTKEYKMIRRLTERIQRKRDHYIKNKDRYVLSQVAQYRQMADTLSLLVEISQENSDIEVVTHEITHQMAGNTGMLPRSIRIPTWVHEGLATYFEAPKDATWSGIGAVNKERLGWYRGLERDRVHSNIRFIVSDRIFTTALSDIGELHGYGQAWGLTHFLMNKRFDDLMHFYRRLGELPPDMLIGPATLEALFSECFGEDQRTLDRQWRLYMNSLRTDVEKFIEEAAR
jgi:hypothetical protein